MMRDWKRSTNPICRRTDLSQDDEKKTKQQSMVGAGIAIGVGVGTALGVAMDNLGAGLGVGIAIGVAIGVSMSSAAKNKDD